MKIKFLPDNIEVEIKQNESVLKVAQDNGIHIKSVCKGVPSCAECKIQIAEGEYNVFPPLPNEINLIGSAYFVDRSRLSCQLKCFGDVTIDLKEQIEKAGRNLASKRPRGSRAIATGDDFDPGASSAVQGSIILDDKKVFEDIASDEKEVEAQRQARQQQNRNANQNRDSRSQQGPSRGNNNPNRDNRNQGHNRPQQGQQRNNQQNNNQQNSNQQNNDQRNQPSGNSQQNSNQNRNNSGNKPK